MPPPAICPDFVCSPMVQARMPSDGRPLPFFQVLPRRSGCFLKSAEKLLDFPSYVFLSKCSQNHAMTLRPGSKSFPCYAGLLPRRFSPSRITGAFAPSLCVRWFRLVSPPPFRHLLAVFHRPFHCCHFDTSFLFFDCRPLRCSHLRCVGAACGVPCVFVYIIILLYCVLVNVLYIFSISLYIRNRKSPGRTWGLRRPAGARFPAPAGAAIYSLYKKESSSLRRWR